MAPFRVALPVAHLPEPATLSTLIHFHQVHKSYPGGHVALRGISLRIEAGEFVFLSGDSGAGKTTLLKILAAVEAPTGGKVSVHGFEIGHIRPHAIPYLRRRLGLIFQDTHLLTDRSVLANVMLPLLVTGTAPRDAAKRARAALDKVGLLPREKLSPLALSGGEQQHLAIARAIVNRPAILIADEPTANLDKSAAERVIDIFRQFNQVGVTVLVSTHDESLQARYPSRLLRLDHGRLLESAEAGPA